MTKPEALKRLARLFGTKLRYREDPKAHRGPEARDAATAALREARQTAADLSAARNARHKALLDGDAEYQRILRDFHAARDCRDTLEAEAGRYRLTVGVEEMGFFLVKAHGDNWADIVRKVEEKKS
ncbi:MAG: hypothetical protein NUW22_05140 [Acidobacteria bacterium]|nr:hypothetical protein [Acidobacteriota bacterium]